MKRQFIIRKRDINVEFNTKYLSAERIYYNMVCAIKASEIFYILLSRKCVFPSLGNECCCDKLRNKLNELKLPKRWAPNQRIFAHFIVVIIRETGELHNVVPPTIQSASIVLTIRLSATTYIV